MCTVTDRFFQAFDAIVERDGVGLRELCRELGARHTSFIKQRAERDRNIIRPHWLEHIVVKYGVSPRWLLTGEGQVFK